MKFRLPVFAAILLLAMGARLGMLLERPQDLVTDPDGYVQHARMISSGKGFAGPFSGAPTAFRPPGFSYLIAWFPGSPANPARAVAMLNVAAGLLTVLMTRQLAENIGLSVMAAQLAAVFVAVDPLLVRYSALPMTEVISGCALTAALMVLVRYRSSISPPPATTALQSNVNRQRVTQGLAGGALLGGFALIRPIGLVVCALLTLGFLVSSVRSGRRQLLSGRARSSNLSSENTRSMRHLTGGIIGAMLPALAFGLVLSPWVVRNWIEFSAVIPATTHGGYTLALGNNPDYYRDVVRGASSRPWDGEQLDAWQRRMQMQSAAAGVPAGDEVAADEFMYQQALRAIRNHPEDFFRACLLRIRTFWGLSPLAATESVPAGAIMACRVWYGGLWCLVVLSVAAAVMSKLRLPVGCLWLTVLSFQIVHTVYWTDTRMRAPLMPVLAVLAAAGFAALCGMLRNPTRHAS